MNREQVFDEHTKPNIDEVIEMYKDMVYGIAVTHVHNKSDADDVAQEVFLAYFLKDITFEGYEHIKSWLIRTTINHCKKITGSTWRKKIVPFEEIGETSFKFETALENIVLTELHQLPYKYRSVLHLFYFESMTINEISILLKIKPGAVKVRLSRGRNLIKGRITIEENTRQSLSGKGDG